MKNPIRRAVLLMLVALGAITDAHAQDERFNVLVYSRGETFVKNSTTEYRHQDARDQSERMIKRIGRKKWNTTVVNDGSVNPFTDDFLSDYSVVVFSSPALAPKDEFTRDQKRALENFIADGGGFVGIHAASAFNTDNSWPWYNELVGAIFKAGHTPADFVARQKLLRTHRIVKPNSFFGAVGNKDWMESEEYYYWDSTSFHPDNNYLFEVEDTQVGPKLDEREKRRPTTWFKEFDGGRSFYTVMGHDGDDYKRRSRLERLVKNAILWASKLKASNDDLDDGMSADKSAVVLYPEIFTDNKVRAESLSNDTQL